MAKTTQQLLNDDLREIEHKMVLGFISVKEGCDRMTEAIYDRYNEYLINDRDDDDFGFMKSFHRMYGILYRLTK